MGVSASAFNDTDADAASAGTAGVSTDEHAQSSANAKTRITMRIFCMNFSIIL